MPSFFVQKKFLNTILCYFQHRVVFCDINNRVKKLAPCCHAIEKCKTGGNGFRPYKVQ